MKVGHMKQLIIIFLNLVLVAHAASDSSKTQLATTLSDANQLVVTSEDFRQLYLWNAANQQLELIDPYSAGQRINHSPDGLLLAYKRFEKTNSGRLLQIPVLFDLKTGQKKELTEPSEVCGIPSIARDGKIVFTQGNELLLFNGSRQLLRKFDLGHYANQTPISPDGKRVVFNDAHDQLWLLDLSSGRQTKLTADRVGYFNPVWSPDSGRLVASTLAGELVIWEIASRREIEIGTGESPNWTPDGNWLVFRSIEKNNRLEIIGSEISLIRFDGQERHELTNSRNQLETNPRLSPDGDMLFYTISGESNAFNAKLIWHGNRPELKQIITRPLPELPASQNSASDDTGMLLKTLAPSSVYFEAPYIHQVYDVPDWFNGHSACGATSAMMGLAFYEILPPWPCTASQPTPHTSDYGRYICEIYEFNDYRYDIGGRDPSGRLGYGGFGFIIQRNWADTKGYMAQYVRQHGLGSSVDWSPSFAKAMVDVDHKYPFVLLNSLTSSGHYILVVGYVANKRQLIVNDPYGDKNLGYKNYRGKLAAYDWPGYYNGYSNLNTVHCYIYMREAPDLAVNRFNVPDTLVLGESVFLDTWIHNPGLSSADSAYAGFYWVESIYDQPIHPAQMRTQIEYLAVGDSFRVRGQVTVPDSTYSGLHGLAIWADDQNQMPEMVETNNYVMEQVVVKGYPYLSGNRPMPGQETSDTTPRIVAKFQDIVSGVDYNSLKLFLDGSDVTDSCKVTERLLIFQTIAPLSYGEHTLAAEVTNLTGFTAKTAWQFTITAPAGITVSENRTAPAQPCLWQNYPNPFNQQTTLRYNVPTASRVELQIFDITGRQVRTLIRKYESAGQHQVTWDGLDTHGRPAASGIYFYRLQVGDKQFLRSMVLIK